MTSKRFTRRYLAKTKRSFELFQRARRSTPGGVESNIRYFKPHPFFSDYGDGGYIFDVDGNEILDFMMGYGALILGHNNRDVAISVIQQLECGSVLGTSTELMIHYLETIKEAMPSMEKVRLTNSGTEATMHAIRVARSYTGKEKIAKAEGAYHGAHDYVIQTLDIEKSDLKRGDYRAIPYGKGIPKAISDLTVIFPFNDMVATEEILEKNADDLAAVIVEPVLCGPGVILPRNNYLKQLRKLTKSLGILLIFDEVLTGFRLSYGGAQEYYGIDADLTTFGKIAGGGFQLGGFGGKEEIMSVISPVRHPGKEGTFHAGTYNAHPISVAAGLKTMEILKDENIYRHVDHLGRELFRGLQDLADDRHIPVHVQYIGSMGCVYFTDREVKTFRDALTNNDKRWRNWFMNCLGYDVMFGIPNPAERCCLCSEHTMEDIEMALEVANISFKAISRAPAKAPAKAYAPMISATRSAQAANSDTTAT